MGTYEMWVEAAGEKISFPPNICIKVTISHGYECKGETILSEKAKI